MKGCLLLTTSFAKIVSEQSVTVSNAEFGWLRVRPVVLWPESSDSTH